MGRARTPAQREAAVRAAVRARAARTEAADERAQRYGELLRGGYTLQQACWELGVARETGQRYQRKLAAADPAGWARWLDARGHWVADGACRRCPG